MSGGMTDGDKMTEFYQIITAFQCFAGKPLRRTDAGAALAESDIDAVKAVIAKLINHYEGEDAQDWPELHRLAAELRKAMRLPPRKEVY